MPSWIYIGLHDDVTDCPNHNDFQQGFGPNHICNNGSCPGHIQNRCLFCGERPLHGNEHLFREVE